MVVGVFGVAIIATSFNFAQHKVSATVPSDNIIADISAGGTLTTADTAQNAISRSGRYVAFTNGLRDIFVSETGL